MAWELNDNSPIYLQLAKIIKQKILVTEYDIGSKLKSVRDLASEAGVNPNTMQKALSELEKDNIIITKGTSGRFVVEDNNIIINLKKEEMKDIISDFLKKSNALGYKSNEIISILETYMTKEGVLNG